jgi:bifunctional DNase/RNase
LVKVKVAHVYRIEFTNPNMPYVLNGPALFILEDIHGKKELKISAESGKALAISEAKYIADGNPPSPNARPQTHDLLYRFMRKSGVTIEKVSIVDIRDHIYFALIHMKYKNGRTEELDTRPTDAIVIALKSGCDIFVNDELLTAKKYSDGSDAEEYLRRKAEEEFALMDSNEEPKA